MELWKFTSGQIQDGGLRPKFQFFNRYNSVAECAIALKFGTIDHVIADAIKNKCSSQGVKDQGHSVT